MAYLFLETPDLANGSSGDTSRIIAGASGAGTPVYDTTINLGGLGSWKCGSAAAVGAITSTVQAGTPGRAQAYFYFQTLPGATTRILIGGTGGTNGASARVTSGGVLQLFNTLSGVKIGSDVLTMSTGTWYRVCLCFGSGTAALYAQAVGGSTYSTTGAITTGTGSTVSTGNFDSAAALVNWTNLVIDDHTGTTDLSPIYITAKRPNANGTANNFGTRVGAGGSGYGSGHSPQVNERVVSSTNGWQVTTTAGTKIEEYNVEGVSVGDVDLTGLTIVDWMGWIYRSAAGSGSTPTKNIIVGGASTAYVSATTAAIFAVAGSTTYPAGTGVDIGMSLSSGSGRTETLLECGIAIAYVPASGSTTNQTLSVTSTATAAAVRTANKIAAVTATASRTLARSVGHVTARTVTATATATRGVAHLMGAVTSTATATLAAGIAYMLTLARTVTATATGTRAAGKVAAVTATATNTTARSVAHITARTVTATASTLRTVGHVTARTVTSTASTLRTIARTAAVTSTATASTLRTVGKIAALTVTGTATGTRTVGKIAALTATVAATLAALFVSGGVGPVVIPLTLAVTVTATALLARSVAHTLAVTATPLPSATRSIAHVAAVAVTTATTSARAAGKVIAVTAAGTATAGRQVAKIVGVAVTGTAGVSKGLALTLTATAGAIATLVAGLLEYLIGRARHAPAADGAATASVLVLAVASSAETATGAARDGATVTGAAQDGEVLL